MIPKFRAWDTDRQKWSPYRISSLRHIDDVEIEFFDTVQGVWYTNEDLEDNWILTQSTGIKDRHGVEIFEGDELTLKYPRDKRYKVTAKVIAGTEVAAMVLKLDDELTTEEFPLYTLSANHNLEVVGNMFEGNYEEFER